MHAFGVRSSSSQHCTSTNPGFFFMPPSFREGVMGQAEPAPLLQPLCGCWCALNQLSYKCQPSPYSRTRPPRGGMGECRAVPGPPMRSASAYLPPTCFAGSWFASAPTHLAKPRTFASLFSATGGTRLRFPLCKKKEDGSSPSSFKKQNSNPSVLALPQPFFQSLLFHGIQSKFTTLQHQ